MKIHQLTQFLHKGKNWLGKYFNNIFFDWFDWMIDFGYICMTFFGSVKTHILLHKEVSYIKWYGMVWYDFDKVKSIYIIWMCATNLAKINIRK